MKFFEPIIENDYECINVVSDNDYEKFRNFNGTLLNSNWTPVMVRRGFHPIDASLKGKESDFPWLGSHALVMNKKSASLLSNMLLLNGEVLPLLTEDGSELFVFNAQIIDALDEGHSVIKKVPGTNSHNFR